MTAFRDGAFRSPLYPRQSKIFLTLVSHSTASYSTEIQANLQLHPFTLLPPANCHPETSGAHLVRIRNYNKMRN